ncbi:MAG: aminoglycoside phosphotransferase family protein [Demequina sp.]|nr:aminoglycoside phosphotransferase family protein [Demequina sp.]
MSWVVGSEVARGATAVITRGEPGTVVKTLTRQLPAIVMALEAAGSRAAMAAGLPAPALLAADLEGDPPTLTFEFVEGRTYAMQSREVGPALIGRILAELQHQIRQVPNPEVIRVEDFLGFQLSQVEVPERLRDAARRDLERLTSHGDRVLCHMDLHDNNVIKSPGGPVVIDWMNASAAPAEADVARTRLVVGNEQFYTPGDAGIMSETLAAYIARTEELAPGLVGASREWDRVIAVARVDEHIPDAEREAILERWGR